MPIPIKVYSDYVCPFCFLGEFPLKEAVQGKDVEVEWMPFELRPAPNPTLRPEGQYLQQAWRNSVYPMAERMGVEIRLPRVSPQPHTDLAFEGFHYAKEHGKGNEYNDRMLRAFFQEEQDIGNVDVLVKLAGEIGLDEVEFRDALASHKYRQTHQQALQHAQEIGIEAVPTFIIGNRVLTGVQDRETLERAIQAATKVGQQV
ncbi:MAG: DsbA family oxidoreductase [Thermoguttaceae bacterium]|jgi:predicted DsbA family dithiol-disulfide isomerase